MRYSHWAVSSRTSAALKICLTALLLLLLPALTLAQSLARVSGWYQVGYHFEDASRKNNTSLAGTGQKMYTLMKYKGKKNNATFFRGRYDSKTGKGLASVSYQVLWSDPPSLLQPGDVPSIDFQRKTLTTHVWSPPNMWARWGTSSNGAFLTPQGKTTVSQDGKTTLKLRRAIPKGRRGSRSVITVTMNYGYVATYTYEWRD